MWNSHWYPQFNFRAVTNLVPRAFWLSGKKEANFLPILNEVAKYK